MSIVASDIQFQLSGGAANSNVNLSFGGAISSVGITDNVTNNLFDNVSSAEAAAGMIDYRLYYNKNNHGTLTLGDARAYISQATTSADDEIDIGICAAALSSTETAPANENTAPASVTFSRPTTYAGGLQLNGATGLAPAAYKGVWVRRTVTAAAAAVTGDNGIVKVEGTTT